MEMGRVVEGGDGTHGALGDIELVVEGELGGDFWEVRFRSGWVRFVPEFHGILLAGAGLAHAAGEECEHHVAVQSVEKQAHAG